MAVEGPVRESCCERFHIREQLRFANRLRENVPADDIVRQTGSKSGGIVLFPGLYSRLHNSSGVHEWCSFLKSFERSSRGTPLSSSQLEHFFPPGFHGAQLFERDERIG